MHGGCPRGRIDLPAGSLLPWAADESFASGFPMFSISESLSDPIYLTQNITISLVPLVMAIIALIIHVAFAVAIFKDASGRRTNGRVVWFVHPIIWAGGDVVGQCLCRCRLLGDPLFDLCATREAVRQRAYRRLTSPEFGAPTWLTIAAAMGVWDSRSLRPFWRTARQFIRGSRNVIKRRRLRWRVLFRGGDDGGVRR